MPLAPLAVRIERPSLVVIVRCPCGAEVRHEDAFDPLAICPACEAELAIELERAGVALGRA